jgi:hypothetical protein
MNSDGDKIYMKIVAFDEIYNFVLSTFFIWSHLVAKKTIYYPDLNFRYPNLGSISFFSGLKMTFRYPDLGSIWFFPFSSWVQMKKNELQSYTSRRKIRFLYKFVSIQVHKRKLRFFGNVLEPFRRVVRRLEVFTKAVLHGSWNTVYGMVFGPKRHLWYGAVVV